MAETHPLILSLRSAGLKDLDPSNMDEVHNMWHAFSKAKNSIDGGDRYEYLSWRLYSREIMRRQAHPRPRCADVTFSPLDSEDEASQTDSDGVSSSSEDDWESVSDSESDQDAAPTSGAMAAQNSPRPSKPRFGNRGKQIRPPKSAATGLTHERSLRNLNRPISSLELQHLFSDVQENPVNPVPAVSSTEVKTNGVSFPAKETKTTKEPKTARLKPEPIASRPRSRRSSAVRGFTPTSVSIKKLEHPAAVAALQQLDSENREDPDFDTDEKPRRMFFIGGLDSDADSSTAGSPDGPPNSQVAAAANDENSDWSDVSDSDEEDVVPEVCEARRRSMFKEKLVPTKPLLQRSLLSSMFVSSMADQQHYRSATPESIRSGAEPVNILLNAALGPHVPIAGSRNDSSQSPEPLAVNFFSNNTRRNGTSESSVEGHEDSPAFFSPTDPMSIVDTLEDGTHITARPEMYRASCSSIGTNPEEASRNSWVHHHEDIYDPLNYHSRGW